MVLSLLLLSGSHLGSPVHFVMLPFPPPQHEVSCFSFHLLQCQPTVLWVFVSLQLPLVTAWGKTGINVLCHRSHNRSWAALHTILTLCFRLSSCVTGYVSLKQSLQFGCRLRPNNDMPLTISPPISPVFHHS